MPSSSSSLFTDGFAILAFIDPEGKEPFVPQVVRDLGEDWDSKIWWVHSESLYTLALAAYLGKRDDFWQHFRHVHDYTQEYFNDPEYGEWYKYLYRDGSVKVAIKGSQVKSAFHIPRALMYLVLLFDGMLAAQGLGLQYVWGGTHGHSESQGHGDQKAGHAGGASPRWRWQRA